VLQPNGALIIVGAAKGDWIAPLMGAIKATVVQPFVDQKVGFFIAQLGQDDMKLLGDLMQTGTVTPVIDRRYALSDAAEAMEYLEAGRARGKVVVNVQ
jgi:NADPH:quinone reductase-like Zn-dependent oxidoreductase